MTNTFVVRPLYSLLYLLRLLFLTSRAGAWAHNLTYFAVAAPFIRTRQREKKFYGIWQSVVNGNWAVVEWQKRIYTSTPKTWRHALESVFIRKLVVGSFRRYRLGRKGHTVPSLIAISPNTPTAGCNLACTHCYADAHPSAVLPIEIFHRIVREGEELGVYSVVVLGGEPFLYNGIWEVFGAHPLTTFYVATNGTHVTRDAVRRLCMLGNVYPMFSLEGDEGETDSIRGEGVFQQVMTAMRHCQVSRLPYGVTLTVTKQNFATVTSDGFISMLSDLRCCGVSYSCYTPIGARPHPEWVITIMQSHQLDAVGEHIRRTYPMMPTIGRNGTARTTGCFAGSEYFHVLPDGRVEGCPFAQWADPSFNIRDHTILEITASPFFQGLRAIATEGLPGITPCRAGEHPALGQFFEEVGASPTTSREKESLRWTRMKTG